jgi:HEAT repeat protein
VVRDALARLPGRATMTIAEALQDASPSVKPALLSVLGRRPSVGQQDYIVKALEDSDASVRLAALGALSSMGDERAMPAVLAFFGGVRDERERAAAESAAVAIARSIADADRRTGRVAQALGSATDISAKASLLRVLGRLGGAEALAALRAAVKDPSPQVQDAGVRGLANWAELEPEAVADLAEIARSSGNSTHQVLALRAYVRLAGSAGLSSADRVGMYANAIQLARRPDEVKLALAGLSEMREPAAVAAVAPLLDDPKVANEAASAVVRIVREMTAADAAASRGVLERAAAVAKDERVKRDATRMLERMKAGQ